MNHGAPGTEGEQEWSCGVQEKLETIKRGSMDDFHRELIPRDGKPHRKGCFPPE